MSVLLTATALVGVTTANATIGSNDYPSYLAGPQKDSVTDPWSFYNRECTSFVAWRLNNDDGASFSDNMKAPNGVNIHWGPASQWLTAANAGGYMINTTPAVGAVALWPSSVGHVGYVAAVNADGTINTEEYNWYTPQFPGGDGLYHTRTSYDWSANGIRFIHVKDITTTPPPPPPPAPVQPILGQPGTVQGDFNGDGKTDAAVFYRYDNAQTVIWLSLGNGTGGFSAPTIAWDSGVGGWNWTVSKPFAGDFNHDGKADIGVLYGYANSESRLWIFSSHGMTFSAPTMAWDSGAGGFDWSRSKWVVSGDFNGDGKADVAVMYGYDNSQTAVFVFAGNASGGLNSPAQWWNSGVGNWTASNTRLTAGDVNADGKTDLIAMYDYGNAQVGVFTLTSTGTAFGSPQQSWNSGVGSWAAANSSLVAGDFNGDGKADLGVFYTYPDSQTKIQVFTATTGGSLTAPTVWWDSGVGQWDGNRILPFVGDFNGDGKADLGALYRYDNSEVAVFYNRSTGTGFAGPTVAWDSGAGQWDGYRVLVS